MNGTMKVFSTMAVLVGVASVLSTGAISARADTQVETINLYSDLSGPVYGTNQNIWTNILVPLFEKQHPNIMVNVTFGGDSDNAALDRIIASVKAKQPSPYDLVDPDAIMTPLEQLHDGVTLNRTNIPLLNEVDPTFLQQSMHQGMPYRGSWVVLLYNSAKVKNPPKTLAQLEAWIKQNPGKFTYCAPNTGGSGGAFVQTVVNSFVPQKDQATFVNSYNAKLESDWTPGLNYLKELGKSMYRGGYYPQGNLGVAQLLASGAIWMGTQWSDGAIDEIRTHMLPPSIKMIQPTPPFNGGPADMVIPKSSAHIKAAETFMNWLLTNTAQQAIVNYMGGFPGVKSEYMSPAIKKQFAAITKYTPAPWYSNDFGNDLSAKWQSVVAAK